MLAISCLYIEVPLCILITCYDLICILACKYLLITTTHKGNGNSINVINQLNVLHLIHWQSVPKPSHALKKCQNSWGNPSSSCWHVSH